ncbi:hypothetical protein BKA70DRAFT_28417 [Coprinopsis sp. MPI-PUGE-AT-0042]|nr:hypothetical protein BKA70DRAFT_28417 [Coprinopsis sp. MPI-PUGE-AT-0042]
MPSNTQSTLLVGLGLSFGLYYVARAVLQRKESNPKSNPATKPSSDATLPFPLPRPLPDFDILTAKPRPYRPFRWTFHQTMALMPLEPDWWLELESTYKERVAQRQDLFRKHGGLILDALPGAELACRELVQTVIEFLTARYPNVFVMDKTTGSFENRILGTRQKVSYEVEEGNEEKAAELLMFLLNNVPEDFAITQKDEETGKYHFRAGVICSAVGWNLGEKIGKPLHEVHGPVPFYDKMLRHSMDRFFDKLPVDKPIQRGSWTFEVGQPLFFQADEPEFAVHKSFNPDLKLDDIHLRVDWQTLRRLPESKAIVFNYKCLFTPVTDFRKEPYIPQLVATVLRDSKTPFKDYKAWGPLEHKFLPALDAWAEEQRIEGLVPEGWEARTLDEHPFYPRWEQHWRHGASSS